MQKNILIDILIQSKTPYIFLYLPSAVITWSIHLGETDRLKKEMKKKDTEVNELKMQMKEKNTEVNELKKQINSLIDIIKGQNKKYQKLETQMNEIISNYKLLNEKKNNGSQSTNNES